MSKEQDKLKNILEYVEKAARKAQKAAKKAKKAAKKAVKAEASIKVEHEKITSASDNNKKRLKGFAKQAAKRAVKKDKAKRKIRR